MRDLADRADVDPLLRRFYGRVLVDDVLAEPFTDVRVAGLDSHSEDVRLMGEVLFRAGHYRAAPCTPTATSTIGLRCPLVTLSAG